MIANNVGDCSCSDHLSQDGYGKCEKAHTSIWLIAKGKFCYVNLPTTCSDVRDSETEPGKKFAWEPCQGKILFLYMNKNVM